MNHFPLKCFKDILTSGTNNGTCFNVDKASFLQLEDLQEEEKRKNSHPVVFFFSLFP